MATIEEARSLLAAGDFAGSVQLFGELLEQNPNESDLMSGFYAASYWQNRQTLLETVPIGSQPGSYLIEEWRKFEKLLVAKNLSITESVNSAMRSVLSYASRQFRHRFQERTINKSDLDVLLQLSKNLLRLSEYRNARDLLGFAMHLDNHRSSTLMLLGESRVQIGLRENDNFEVDKGYSNIRDSFLLHPAPLLLDDYTSKPAVDIIEQMKRQIGADSIETITNWLPAEWMAAVLNRPNLRRLSSDEILQIEDESNRLEQDLPNMADRFIEKASSRLCYFSLVLLHSLVHHYDNSVRQSELIELINQLRPGLIRL
ncbi:MAG: hypothetical protein H3C43_07000 [Leptonema sp. (in: Bacteria)]|nr:hypothetical protein [Leptonema sp. (in: bacteria)]